jgi:hypothetical protein
MSPFDNLPTQNEISLLADASAIEGKKLREDALRKFAAILPYIEAAKAGGTPLTDTLLGTDPFWIHTIEGMSGQISVLTDHARSLEIANAAIRVAVIEEGLKVKHGFRDHNYYRDTAEYMNGYRDAVDDYKFALRALLNKEVKS